MRSNTVFKITVQNKTVKLYKIKKLYQGKDKKSKSLFRLYSKSQSAFNRPTFLNLHNT